MILYESDVSLPPRPGAHRAPAAVLAPAAAAVTSYVINVVGATAGGCFKINMYGELVQVVASANQVTEPIC
jgi:hypothetical protein